MLGYWIALPLARWLHRIHNAKRSRKRVLDYAMHNRIGFVGGRTDTPTSNSIRPRHAPPTARPIGHLLRQCNPGPPKKERRRVQHQCMITSKSHYGEIGAHGICNSITKSFDLNFPIHATNGGRHQFCTTNPIFLYAKTHTTFLIAFLLKLPLIVFGEDEEEEVPTEY